MHIKDIGRTARSIVKSRPWPPELRTVGERLAISMTLMSIPVGTSSLEVHHDTDHFLRLDPDGGADRSREGPAHLRSEVSDGGASYPRRTCTTPHHWR